MGGTAVPRPWRNKVQGVWGWEGMESLPRAPHSLSLLPPPHGCSVVVRLILSFPQPGKKGRHRFESHSLALLLGRVLAGLPLVESLLLDDVLVVEGIKEHPQQVWGGYKGESLPFPSLQLACWGREVPATPLLSPPVPPHSLGGWSNFTTKACRA